MGCTPVIYTPMRCIVKVVVQQVRERRRGSVEDEDDK
jgi:hypothetical protein